MNSRFQIGRTPLECFRSWIDDSYLIALLVVALSNGSASATTNYVSIEAFTFVPDQLAVNVGDTVVWTAFEPEHTVSSDDGLFDSTPLWDTIPYLETFRHTFSATGDYRYFCGTHGGPGGSGMSGIIVVSEPGANQAPSTPLNQLPANGATDQPLTVQLQASAFSDPNPQDFHAASQWIVRRASDHQIIFDSGEESVNRTNRAVPDGSLVHGSSYTWQVRYKDGRGAWSEYSAATTFATLVPVVATGTGLKASYHNVIDFALPLAVVTNASINFDWGKARPHRRITADDFAARWEGFVLPQFTELYDIQFQYRGRARVWVNNQLLIDEWHGCAFSQTRRGLTSLVGGQLAVVRVEYAADPAGAQAVLRWSSPSLPLEVIPSVRLFPPSP